MPEFLYFAHAPSSRSTTRDIIGVDALTNSACQINDASEKSSESDGNDDMACIIGDDDGSSENDSIIKDGASALAHGLLPHDTIINHAINMRGITHPAKTWVPAVFPGVYLSGAAPPGCVANGNCQNTWLGGKIAVTLQVIGIGGEVKQIIPKCFAPEIRRALGAKPWKARMSFGRRQAPQQARAVFSAREFSFHSNTRDGINTDAVANKTFDGAGTRRSLNP